MAGVSLPLAFGSLVAGAVIIDYGGKAVAQAFASGGPSASATGSGNPKVTGNFPPSVNPTPGLQTSRLDQGIDGTGTTFLAPWDGKVVVSNAHSTGWDGGGYIAIQSTQNPSFVYYVAEGVSPIVRLGQMVTAGQKIAVPVTNPYNGIVGNIEQGRANPANPGNPLAQSVSDAAGMVFDFYHWFLSLGGAPSTDTSSAGHA